MEKNLTTKNNIYIAESHLFLLVSSRMVGNERNKSERAA